MERADDPGSVIDPSLRLIGRTNIRVVKASIIPEIVAGNTNGLTMMIAEKASDHILGV